VNGSAAASDLIVVTADIDAAGAIRALLERHQALSIRRITATVDRYVGRDSGCYRRAHEYLRPFISQFNYALVVFDRHGCGSEGRSRLLLEEDVQQRLRRNGWADRSAAIVLDPELEAWVWSDSPEVDRILGWTGRKPDLRTWLREQSLWPDDVSKPTHPKRAMQSALQHARKPRSPAVYRQLAESVGVQRCADPTFEKLRATLRRWFAAE
jgi:hypothetical protein